MDNQWYNSASNSGWYDSAAQSASAPESAPRRRRRGCLITLLAVWGVLVLIVISALIFGGRGSVPDASLPGGGKNGDFSDFAEDFAEDFRDFFEGYYTPQEEHEECTIPTVDHFTSFAMELLPQGENDLTLQQVYEKCVPSVVGVTAYIKENDDDRYYWGTGIVLTEDGYIVTNAHVVEGSCRGKITLWNDEEYDALLVGYDSRSDIAVLKIDAHGLVPAEFCDTDTLAVGDQVVAIGNPLGIEFRSTMTEGIISGIDRDISYNGTTLTLLQTSTPINEGNSGGPLINMSGQVVGITNMKMSSSAGAVTIEGVGFAIPSKTVKTMADSILSHGKVLGRPALGLTLGAVPDAAREEYDLPSGLYVTAVSAGSDCEAKGILPGDILLSVNGNPAKTTEDVTGVIKELSVGDTMDLSFWRSGENGEAEYYDVTVKLVDVNDVY